VRITASLAALAGCHVVGLAPKAAPTAAAGAPRFELPSHRGERVALDARDTVIVFYRGHW
jgi:hypothetical protein